MDVSFNNYKWLCLNLFFFIFSVVIIIIIVIVIIIIMLVLHIDSVNGNSLLET